MYIRISVHQCCGNGNVIVMELFQSQSSCNGSWYYFATCIKLHNYHATTLMDIVYICGYILPPKKVDFASSRLFSVLQ